MRKERPRPGEEHVIGHLDLDVYSLRDISIRTGLNRDTLIKAIKAGELKAKNFGGARGWLVLRENLMPWLRDGSHEPSPATSSETA